MSENNQSNGEIKENKADYEGEDYQENQFSTNNPVADSRMNYRGETTRDFSPRSRETMEVPRNYGPGPNPQHNTPNKAAYVNPNYQANNNQSQMNNYRGDGRMNNPGNYRGNGGMNYSGNYREDGRVNNPGNYRGDDRMNYPENYRGDGRMNYPGNYIADDGMNYQAHYRGDGRTNYPVNYRGGDDYYYDRPQPYYHHDYDCDCDYYEGRRPYYRGYRPYKRVRGMAGYPNMPGYDPYYNQGMMPGSWWHPNMIRDFINRPRVNDFLRGVGIATVGLILAPTITKTLRPIVVKAVQGAMATSDEVKSIFVDAKEDMEDIFAEAKWEGSKNEGYHHGEDERQNK